VRDAIVRSILGGALAAACAHDAEPLPCAETGDTDAACGTTMDSGASSGSNDPSGPDDTITPDSSGTAPSESSTSTPQPESSTTENTACTEDSECGPDAPFCDGDTCVTCDHLREPNAGCSMLDPDLPLCVDTTCVQCSERDATQCTGAEPVCDLATHACVPCTEHEQCPVSACDMIDGSCFAPEVVFHVDGDAGGCIAADGTEMDPFCSIGDALDPIGPGSRAALRVAATAAPYDETFTISADRILAIVPWGDVPPVFDPLASTPTITVDGAVAYLGGVRLEGNTISPALSLDGAVVYVDRVVIAQNDGGGMAMQTDTELHLRNSVIGANGTGLAERYAIDADASTFDILYSTIAGNDGTTPASLRCTGGATGSVRNSIVVGVETPSIQCAGVEVETSAVDTDGLGGADVIVLDAFVAGWFVDAPVGDFHLVPDTLFEDVGVWQTGDPAVDLDGDPRPTRDGTVDVAGADLPVR
jgi:hypothetical protein